jgi:hypothetical protein
MVGDSGGWKLALYLVSVILFLIFVIRMFLVDSAIFVFNNLFHTDHVQHYHSRFNAFYYHSPVGDSRPHDRDSMFSLRSSEHSEPFSDNGGPIPQQQAASNSTKPTDSTDSSSKL